MDNPMTLPLPNNQNFPPLRVLSFGAGAIGTYIGGSLALVGHQVVFLEKAAIAQTLKQQVMQLEIAGVVHDLPHPSIVDSPGARSLLSSAFCLKIL
jgi:ketopantoate reductase